MTGVTFFRGVWLATFAAGPLFMVVMGVGACVADRAACDLPSDSLPALAGAVSFGAVLSILPNLVGTLTLATLGRRTLGARRPIIWALAGAGFGGFLGLQAVIADHAFLLPLFTATGLACALLCRAGTRWTD